jgi:signal transduction histidine kinase
MVELTRDERRDALTGAAQNYAAALHERSDLFAAQSETALPGGAQAVVAARLARVVVDGRLSEWADQPRFAVPVQPLGSAPPDTLTASIAVASTAEDTYLLLEAVDERYVPRQQLPDSNKVLAGDTVLMWAGESPETMSPVTAEPSETRTGWLVETVLPRATRFVRVRIDDVDYQASRVTEANADSGLLIVVGGKDEADSLKDIQVRERARLWDTAIAGIDRSGLRVAVYDVSGNLLAMRGDFDRSARKHDGWLSRIAHRLLSWTVGLGMVEASTGTADDQPPLSRALSGFASGNSRRITNEGDEPFWVTTSAHPIWRQDRIAGALLLEQGSRNDLDVAQNALEWLALWTAAAIVASVLGLLSIASLTVARIRRLKLSADTAIDARGRVVGAMPDFKLQDEVSELASSYDSVLGRLREHQHYLSNLRARLVHELRTPIMIVRSSLENLNDPVVRDEPPANDVQSGQRQAYVDRALGGAMRLERLVASMSEASSVESMLSRSQLEQTDLRGLLDSLAQAYNQAYDSRREDVSAGKDNGAGSPRFQVESALKTADALVIPESIAQAIDKLASNAADFSDGTAPITLELESGTGGYSIAVRNRGKPLPDVMTDSLFESMVSVRTETAREQSHLGLGLYLVRLIAEFHGGRPFAVNTVDGVRIGFTISASLERGEHDEHN